ncbi:D(1) dopamine receptor-like [Saccoglossus kowalevskii]|uniref:D(1) dopamine receptor-like n=1 Tax=Saccoglossus kowalevskii TaxID=10224 RepID=A0ABM0MHR5_SACKO|nr:PREDICTED: D(1) dopamine receptor-like [Saccoglossus kowalevskii]
MDSYIDNDTLSSTVDYPNIGYQLTVGTLLYAIILVTVLGNILVICSVVSFRRLRTVTNYFIVSLAVSDLTIATVVMPFSAANQVLGYWSFGTIFCNIYVCLDVLCCTASIINLCMISLDRYLAITSPFTYYRRMTPLTASIMITVTYVVSVLISVVPVILGLHEDDRHRDLYDDPYFCVLLLNPTYALVSSLISFYVPTIVILFTYAKIFCVAKKHQQKIHAQEDTAKRMKVLSAKDGKKRFSMTRERKAAKTLAIIVGVFILCWLPFFILNIIDPYCFGCVPVTLFTISVWLGYINSCINPFIYAFNSDFRRAFRKLLFCYKCRGIYDRETSSIEASKTQHERRDSISHVSCGPTMAHYNDHNINAITTENNHLSPNHT